MRGWFPRSALISAAIFGCLVLALVGVVAFVHHQDTRRSAQTVTTIPPPPKVGHLGDGCDPPTWSPTVTNGTGGRVTADQHPMGAVVYWLPGSRSANCRVVVTNLTAAEADSLARDVRDSTSRGGTFSCPMDDGSTAWIFFRYSGRPHVEVVDAALSGCTTAGAPGRTAVGPSWRGGDRLQSLSPTGL
jgi:hypothetical protein